MIMKLTRSIFASVIITLLAFTAVLYSSCTKNKCANTTCQNGGSCSDGFCTCPRGYSGDHCEIPATSTIEFINHALTPITLTLNNYAYTIPVGQTKGFTGKFGDSLNGNAFTHGTYGEQINWDTVSSVFPINGVQYVYFDVNPNYFFLVLQNDSSSSALREIIVNRGLSTESDIFIAAPYIVYPNTISVGYFYASASSNVYVKSVAQYGFNFPAPLAIPNISNQQVVVIAH